MDSFPFQLIDPGVVVAGILVIWWRMNGVEKRLDRIERRLDGLRLDG